MEGRNYEGKELGREELGRIRKEGIRKGLIPCDLSKTFWNMNLNLFANGLSSTEFLIIRLLW